SFGIYSSCPMSRAFTFGRSVHFGIFFPPRHWLNSPNSSCLTCHYLTTSAGIPGTRQPLRGCHCQDCRNVHTPMSSCIPFIEKIGRDRSWSNKVRPDSLIYFLICLISLSWWVVKNGEKK